MGLLRLILAVIVLIILAHLALFYLGYGANGNVWISAMGRVGNLLEWPVRRFVRIRGFYATALIAAAGYLVIYVLLGFASRRR